MLDPAPCIRRCQLRPATPFLPWTMKWWACYYCQQVYVALSTSISKPKSWIMPSGSPGLKLVSRSLLAPALWQAASWQGYVPSSPAFWPSLGSLSGISMPPAFDWLHPKLRLSLFISYWKLITLSRLIKLVLLLCFTYGCWLLALKNESSRVLSSHCLCFVFSPWHSGVMSGWSLIIESKTQSTRTATHLLAWHRESTRTIFIIQFWPYS